MNRYKCIDYENGSNSFIRLTDNSIEIDQLSSPNTGEDFNTLTCSPRTLICNPRAPYSKLDPLVDISYRAIIWAQVSPDNAPIVSISYLSSLKSRAKVIVRKFQTESYDLAKSLAQSIMDSAYQGALPSKRLLILINPFSGKGIAKRYYMTWAKPILQAAHCELHEVMTQESGHARDIARNLNLSKYDAIVCCSGDGLIHEVLNGLYRHNDAAQALKIPFAQIPGGTGNALSMNLASTGDPSIACLSIIKGKPRPTDLSIITQSGGESFLSFLSQTCGLIAESDISTENLRWLGPERVTIGVLKGLYSMKSFPCELSYKLISDSKSEIKNLSKSKQDSTFHSTGTKNDLELKYGTVDSPIPDDWITESLPNMFIFYAGLIPWVSTDALAFPASRHTDGHIDLLIMNTTSSRFAIAKSLLKFSSGQHFDDINAIYKKVEAYRFTPKFSSSYLSIDGENCPVGAFQVEIHNDVGTVLCEDDSPYHRSQLPTS